jgi:hypothetical protein
LIVLPACTKPLPPPVASRAKMPPASVASPVGNQVCVKDALDHAFRLADQMPDSHGEINVSAPANFVESAMADADGDGQPELLLIEPRLGRDDRPYFLYLSNRGCGRYGGVIWAHAESIQVLPEVRNGLRMLELFNGARCAGREGTIRRLAWDGDHYVVAQEIKCPCPDNPEQAHRPRDRACP